MNCPKCGFKQDDSNQECLRCGLVFSKYEALQKRKEQTNAQYSPGKDPEEKGPPTIAADEEETIISAPPSSLQVKEDIIEKIEKLQVGIHSTLTFQEGLARKLERQQSMTQELFNQFNTFKENVDQQVLTLQSQIQPVIMSSFT